MAVQKIKYKSKCYHCQKELTDETKCEVRNPHKCFVCEDCRDKNYGYCENCETYKSNDEIAYSGSVQCCDSCASKITRYTRMGNPLWL